MTSDAPVIGKVRHLLLRDHARFGGVTLDGERGPEYWIAIDRLARVVFDRTFGVYRRPQEPAQRIADPDLLQEIRAELTRWLGLPFWQDDTGCDLCDDARGARLADVATQVGPVREDYLALWRCDTCGTFFERSEWDRFLTSYRVTASTARSHFPGAVPLAEAVVEQLRVRGQLTRAAGELLVELELLDERPPAQAAGDPDQARRDVTVALLRDAAQVEPDDRLPRRIAELRDLLDAPDLPSDRPSIDTHLRRHP